MCGIAGLVQFDGGPAPLETLQAMAASIAHRGPDGEGFWSQDGVGLAHRRLAIIDLTAAAQQPMASACGTFVLTYNGEIYNYRELRRELEALGHMFHSQSDSEVVLVALMQWGSAALRRFNGMFALAFWNARQRCLLLARDRYGIKPLYYATVGQSLAFASEHKAILVVPGHRRRLDHSALVEYFTFQNIFTNKTLLQGIHLLEPGHYAEIHPDRAAPVVPVEYWDFDFREPEGDVDVREYEEELDRLFIAAVRRQMVSDVEIGCYLSGGMDSGSITAIASKINPYIKSFTCGFDLRSASGLELAFDEREKAEYMSYVFKTEHYEMVLKAGDMERILPSLAWHLEEPRVGQSYPNFYAARLAARFVKVVLSGTGGDELFGGYPWRYYRAGTNDNFEDYIDKYYAYWQRLIPQEVLQDVFTPIGAQLANVSTRDIFRDVFRHRPKRLARAEDYLNHSLYFEAKTFLHGLLVVEDKLSMACGLESRVPFLDNDLVDFAMRCPIRFKLKHLGAVPRMSENEPGLKSATYFSRTSDGKRILRDVMKRHIPSDIASGAKQGFSAPDASWFRGESIDFVRRTLLQGQPRIYEIMNRDTVVRLVEQHLAGQENRRLLIWSLLNFETWLRQMDCALV